MSDNNGVECSSFEKLLLNLRSVEYSWWDVFKGFGIERNNQNVDIYAPRTNVRDGLLKTGRFELAPFGYNRGYEYSLRHKDTDAKVLVNYEGDHEDLLAGKPRDPEPEWSYVSIHSMTERNPDWNVPHMALVLNDILLYAKKEKVRLEIHSIKRKFEYLP